MKHVAFIVIAAIVLAGQATGLDLAKVCALDLSNCSVHCVDGTKADATTISDFSLAPFTRSGH
jgi:hypothetical protein